MPVSEAGEVPEMTPLSGFEAMLATKVQQSMLSTTAEIIDEARNGRMFILVDDEDRENEGDLIVPGQMATPDAINFMARHGRGLVCLALTSQRAGQLGLSLMSPGGGNRHQTAFTASIEAREGVTTGISAADRARTIAVAVNGHSAPDDLVSPGHVFPLIARDGGVLVRAGHTEAAVDISRLAGLNRSAVICEIMRDDGTMARLPELVRFAQVHGLKIGTIRDLIAYRLRHDNPIELTSEAAFESRWGGTWTAKTFLDRSVGSEQIALIKGSIDPARPTLVRMHQLDICSDAFGETGRKGSLLPAAMMKIAQEGAGVIVAINRMVSNPFSQALEARGRSGRRDMEALRDYGLGAQILAALGVHEMVLLTNHHHTPVALEGFGLKIVAEQAIAPLGEGGRDSGSE